MTPVPRNHALYRLTFDLVGLDDAEFICGLRADPSLNRHLSPTSPSVDDQRAWIARYKADEQQGRQCYYVIRRTDDSTRCGVVRLYDIGQGRFTWGSWILGANKPDKAALESAVMVYRIGFDALALERAVFDVRNDNGHVLEFHRRFGASETGRDDENTYFEYCAADFRAAYPGFDRILRPQIQTGTAP